MPIRINLLAEALAAEDFRRRDPVKRAIFVGVFLVALALVWFSSIWLTYFIYKQRLNQIQADIQTHAKDYAQVQSNQKKIAEMQSRMDALDQLSAARFLQGNLLNAMQTTHVPGVQMTRLRLDQSYSSAVPPPLKNASTGATIARPPVVTERTVLTLDARDFSPNPGDQVNHFKEALMKQDFFKPLIDPAIGIRVSGISAQQTLGDSKPFVMFSLECRFLDKTP